ncbi:glycosyltransferase [Pseudobacteriovorax antillogorgiicola]|uniref:Glycosyltransferase involved in cell wall bisynthesis n=1 Tax=Pseudobacteriovorax antillogorgiicola TaxID=1513793 RepID=A0A1Y6CNZ1_9BACT|nr:glycosyltransferase [Pseudobacteriovorax antillogorgiicola]TCS43631.1 glycosyltransferase involved in cell wall biosynthesis [Pseudobacteriovorax antillogorgiicola]SMF79994.1 Glycosyltransferase involved in cell wall bisynthesis [Pseudobacteriovorax antillogorgiicola]
MSLKKRIRLGYLVPEFPAQTHAFFWREVTALRTLGAEVCLISTRSPALSDQGQHQFIAEAKNQTHYLYPPRDLLGAIEFITRPSWTIRSISYITSLKGVSLKYRMRLLGLLVMAAQLTRYVKRNGIEHIHGHSCADVAHVLALVGLSRLCSYSLSLHGNLSVYGSHHREKTAFAKFVAPVTRPLQEELLKATNLKRKQLPVIWMGVDLKRFSPTTPQWSDKTLKLVTVARLNPSKGHTYALQAIQRLKLEGHSVFYQIVGGGELRQSLEREVRDRDLESIVRFTGSLGEDDVQRVISHAHVLLLTSFGHGEAAPVCVMEAMASARPVISSLIGGTADMIDSGKTGFLVEQKNVQQISDRILEFIKDKSLVKRLGDAARSFAEENFDSQKQAHKLFDQITMEQ